MTKVADEQIYQLFNRVTHLEDALKAIKREARAIDDQLIVDLVDIALSYGDEDVNFKSSITQGCEKAPTGRHGGTTTLMGELEAGTVFYVHNGAWSGEIVKRNGKKCILIKGDKIEDAKEIHEDATLDITIK